jgi:hypothetical protein
MTDEEMRGLIETARAIAAEVGSLHPAWDVIFDAEAMLDNKRMLVPVSRTTMERWLCEISGYRTNT